MNVTIVGTGYVGLVTGVCLASKYHNIICVDINEEIINDLNKGIVHFYEKDLEDLLYQVINKGHFKATTDLSYALSKSDVVIVAVGTPSDKGKIDLNQIETVCTKIGEYIKSTDKFLSVVIKSTVIPSITDTFIKDILEKTSGKKLGEFGIGMNPEFLKEGEAINDFLNPDRIVIGFEDKNTKKLLTEIYFSWNCDKIFVNTRTAEMIKYTNNTLLACLISVNNELANVASKLGNIDYNDVIEGIISDRRWSPIIKDERITPPITSYFTPGAGFGGSCFPKDVQAIRTQGEDLGLKMSMVNSILDVNNNQPNQILDLIYKVYDKYTYPPKILLLGLSFKPETDDIRESSSIKILSLMLNEGFKVIVHDPLCEYKIKNIEFPNIEFTKNWRDEISNVNLIIIGTNWPEYKFLKNYFYILKEKNIALLDTKRLFNISETNDINYLTFGYTKNE